MVVKLVSVVVFGGGEHVRVSRGSCFYASKFAQCILWIKLNSYTYLSFGVWDLLVPVCCTHYLDI